MRRTFLVASVSASSVWVWSRPSWPWGGSTSRTRPAGRPSEAAGTWCPAGRTLGAAFQIRRTIIIQKNTFLRSCRILVCLSDYKRTKTPNSRKSINGESGSVYEPVLRIRYILVRIQIRIRGSVPLTNGFWYFRQWPSRWQPKKFFLCILLITFWITFT